MKNIVLIGMSGVGKTTIGKQLSIFTKRQFIDMDELIVQKMNMEINDIFSKYGEPYFRKIESDLIGDIFEYENTIISTGGGIILNEENIINLKKKGIIVFLQASIDTINNNLKNATTIRPLLNNNKGLSNSLKTLYSKRKDLYLSASDLTVSVDNKSIEKISYEILEGCVKINT